MNELLKKIYNEILVYEKDIVTTNKTVDDVISNQIKPYEKKLPENEYEELKGLVFSAISIAEQAGFENGLQFTIKMLHTLFND